MLVATSHAPECNQGCERGNTTSQKLDSLQSTYTDARVKLHQAEYTSDLTDTDDRLRKRKGSAKLFESQKSKQLESTENSDSEEEFPPTPPEKLLGLAAKQMISPTAQRVASSTIQQGASPTAQRVASSTIQQGASPTAQRAASSTIQQGASPTAQRVASSTIQQGASPTAQRVASSTIQQGASPTAQSLATPGCEAMFSKLLTILEEVKETQRVHSKILNALLKKQEAPVMEVPEGVAFPLQTQADVEALDEKLKDRSLMSTVAAVVADVGGTSVDDATRRMMKFLLSNELALDYNLFGRHGKKKFKDLRLFSVVYEALKKNTLTAQVNQQEAERALSKWFTGARDRGGRRASRQPMQT
ncbi:coiled-coil domain-containing protein 8 homolog isoform X2 [Melanotaenia boesemani]|uniref:coiled-coil domain-containing protein 8 homolog isoform X2 n=1 Tax=Melanotaenia boesemani TaxID=1250792 RepID=UPI001C04DF90|nr:coiled-coil domain-containing protein 8 homolog isoform X2 [Melanotaenia boesemani]